MMLHIVSKMCNFLFAMFFVLFGTPIVENAAAQVAGGKHDLSYTGGSNFKYFTDEVCIFCHTPHGSNTTQTYSTDAAFIGGGGNLNGKFLWNRALPSRSWTMYSSDTLDHTLDAAPGPLSLLCLSCHDGVGAMNVLLNNPAGGQPIEWLGSVSINQFGDAPADEFIGSLNIGNAVCDGGLGTSCSGGGNLQDDHPIGFAYAPNAHALDPGLYDLNAIANSLVRDRMLNVTGGRMECSSCHDPHRTNTGGASSNQFLVIDNTGSQLCRACHNK